MTQITLKPIRQVTTVTMRVTLTDNGVKVSWPDLDSVKAFVYSEQQRLVAGACTVEVDGSDDTVLICTYSADKPQYLGPQKAVIVAEYQGQMSTYDKLAFTFVATTAETLSDGTTIADDTTDVDIDVEDVSSSILAGAIAAALAAAENANDAADDATAAAQEARDAAASVPSVDNFYTKQEVDTIAAGKQDKLASGENIKTINGQSILGEGDIEIQGGGGSPDAVLFTEQTLTSEQQAQARSNIGAGTSNFSGSYDDLSNKPSIPAAQVNADWDANSGVAQILNKPTIPEAQIQSDWEQSDNTKKDYIKNKPSIPAAQVQSDWSQSDSSAVDFIKNKPTELELTSQIIDALWAAAS